MITFCFKISVGEAAVSTGLGRKKQQKAIKATKSNKKEQNATKCNKKQQKATKNNKKQQKATKSNKKQKKELHIRLPYI